MDQLEVVNIHKDYEGKPLLNGISFKVQSGNTLCLLGRSGSGKSTLLRIIAGLESPDEGEILWNGTNITDVPTHKRNFGLMFQDYALFPHRNVFENVSFGLQMNDTPTSEISVLVESALKQVNLLGLEKRGVTDLSGGEQQRVALARALAPRPRLLMLDEPLSALDRTLRMELQEELRDVIKKSGVPAIYVTHDQEEAITLADELVIMRDGRIEQTGKPEQIYASPSNRWVAEFLGMTNFLLGKVISTMPLEVQTSLGRFRPGQCNSRNHAQGDLVTLLLKPTGAGFSPKEGTVNVVEGIVSECQFRGDFFRLKITLKNQPSMEFIISKPVEVNSIVKLKIPEASIICLGE
jgi:ABC-type Fe3+/spermidine/putrescine transport system ATPase subunit